VENKEHSEDIFPSGFGGRLDNYHKSYKARLEEMRASGQLGPEAEMLPREEWERLMDECGLTGAYE
jgi:hypothetical protein